MEDYLRDLILIIMTLILVLVIGVSVATREREPRYVQCTFDGRVTMQSPPTTKAIYIESRSSGEWQTGSGVYYPRPGELCRVYKVAKK